MNSNQMAILTGSYHKRSVGPEGKDAPLAGYVKYATDTSVDMVDSKDLVFVDVPNEMVHCVYVNDDAYSQCNYPIKILSAAFEDIHVVESVLTTHNFEVLMNEGFLKDLLSADKAKFVKDWIKAKTNHLQAQQPVNATPFYTEEARAVNAIKVNKERDDGITQIANGATYPKAETT